MQVVETSLHSKDVLGLTPREVQIAGMIADGHSNKTIASELGLAYSTVKNHVSSILDKLHLEGRTQLAIHVRSFTMS